MLGGGSADEGKSLEKTKRRSFRLYLDLFEAFEAKHAMIPQFRRSTAGSGVASSGISRGETRDQLLGR